MDKSIEVAIAEGVLSANLKEVSRKGVRGGRYGGSEAIKWVGALLSVNIFRDQSQRGLDHDFDIEPQRPVINIVEVNFNPLPHLFNGIGLAETTTALGQTDSVVHCV